MNATDPMPATPLQNPTRSTVRSAEVVIRCDDVTEAMGFYHECLGFLVDAIFPADAPKIVVLRGYGLRIRLDPNGPGPAHLRLICDNPREIADTDSLVAPDGTVVELISANPPLVLPDVAQSFVFQRASDDSSWGVGRAGMRYRDLIPDRQGGRFIASHIQIPDAGLVPDYVHFHKVRFQMIFCYRGWVRLVYEDQGEPFIMRAGDCVLQPPQIRHRVLESSAGLEVIEIGCPALHETFADPMMPLPNPVVNPGRDFHGQTYILHRSEGAPWSPGYRGLERRRFGLREATGGIAEASVLRPASVSGASGNVSAAHDGEFYFAFVLDGSTALQREAEEPLPMAVGDSVVIPAGECFAFENPSADLEILEVILPG
jgi:mannose-6-phosphate isomerase-like protein (cupin superfamily)